MAINQFAEKAARFISILDEVYGNQAKTAVLDDPVLSERFMGANKVMLPKVAVDGAGNYDRDQGYVQGCVAVSYEEHELRYDRGRKFRIDAVDNDEAAFDLYRQVALQYVKTKEIPEIDAIRFMEMFKAANKTDGPGTLVQEDINGSDSVLKLFDRAEAVLNEKEVPEEGRVLFCSHGFYEQLKNDSSLSRRLDVGEAAGGEIDRRVLLLDGCTPVIKVPQGRFVSEITLHDGKSAGQTGGHFAPKAGAFDLNFVYAGRDTLQGVIKRSVSKIIMPEENQSADAYDVFYRVHHDLIVREYDAAGIYVHAKKTARA